MIQLSTQLGINSPFQQKNQVTQQDDRGYAVACNMLLISITGKGKHDPNHLQFGSVREFRSCYGNYIRAPSSPMETNLSLVNQDGAFFRLTQDVCGSLWFHRFLEGMANRMGNLHKPNLAMSIQLLTNFF